MRASRGTSLLLILLLAGLAVQYGRRSLLSRSGPPAFFVEKHPGVLVSLGPGFPQPGIYQFSDGATPLSVIQMTPFLSSPELAEKEEAARPLRSGEALDIVRSGAKVIGVKRDWMPARQRMTLGIPLRVDRMSFRDWQALPGIGPAFARRVEIDRQQNGGFGSLEALQRVRGIGPKHIKDWKKFFLKERQHHRLLK